MKKYNVTSNKAISYKEILTNMIFIFISNLRQNLVLNPLQRR